MSRQTKRGALALGAPLMALCLAGPLAAQMPTVTVQNNHHDDLKVYLQQKDHPTDVELGGVDGFGTSTFIVPPWALDDEQQVGFVVVNESGMVREGDAYPLDQGPDYGIMVGHTGRRAKTDDRMWADPSTLGMDMTTLTIRNENDHPRKVFLQQPNHDVQLGIVPAHMELSLGIPQSFVGERGEVVIVNHEGSVLGSHMLDLEQGRHFGLTLED